MRARHPTRTQNACRGVGCNDCYQEPTEPYDRGHMPHSPTSGILQSSLENLPSLSYRSRIPSGPTKSTTSSAIVSTCPSIGSPVRHSGGIVSSVLQISSSTLRCGSMQFPSKTIDADRSGPRPEQAESPRPTRITQNAHLDRPTTSSIPTPYSCRATANGPR